MFHLFLNSTACTQPVDQTSDSFNVFQHF